MNKRIPQYLSAAVLVFLMFFALQMVSSSSFSNIGDFLVREAVFSIPYIGILIALIIGLTGQLYTKNWGYILTAVVLVPVALGALVVSYFILNALSFLFSSDLPNPLSTGYRATVCAVIVFPLLALVALASLIRYIRQKK